MSDAAPNEQGRDPALTAPPATFRRWFAPLLTVPTPVVFAAAAAIAALLLWRRGGLDEIGASLRQAHPADAVAVLGLYAASILVLGMRWHALVRMTDGRPAWTASVEVFLTSVIINYAAPIGLAVPTRAALTVRDLGLTPTQSGTVVAWEASLDVVTLGVISVLWLGLGGSDLLLTIGVDRRLALLGGLVVLAVLGVAWALLRRAGVRARVESFARGMAGSPRRRPLAALCAVAATIAFWGMQLGVMAGVLGIFGVATTPSLLLGLMGLPVLIGMLSPVPGGAGVREALMAAVAGLEGVVAGPVILAAVTYRLALFAVTPAVWAIVRLARTMMGGR